MCRLRRRDGALEVVDLESGEVEPFGARPGGLGPASDVALVLRELRPRAPVVTIPTPHRRGSYGLVFSPDGGRLFTAGAEGVRAWRLDRFLGDAEAHLEREQSRYGFRLAWFRLVPGE